MESVKTLLVPRTNGTYCKVRQSYEVPTLNRKVLENFGSHPPEKKGIDFQGDRRFFAHNSRVDLLGIKTYSYDLPSRVFYTVFRAHCKTELIVCRTVNVFPRFKFVRRGTQTLSTFVRLLGL